MIKLGNNFKIIKDEKGIVKEFGLIAIGSGILEQFCATFPEALANRKANIRLTNNGIIFNNLACGNPQSCEHKLSPDDITSLDRFLKDKRKKRIERIGPSTPGFRILFA